MRTQNKNNIWNPMSSFGGYLVPTEHGHFGPFWEVAKIALLNPSFEMLFKQYFFGNLYSAYSNGQMG